jgi:hypothetical protein
MSRPRHSIHSSPAHQHAEEPESGSDSPDTLPATVMTGILVRDLLRRLPNAQRNPMLLLRLSGLFLLRFAERQLFGLLFQLPPRRTRPYQPDPV